MGEEEMNTVIPIEEKHSVKFGINAKGNWSGEVKCYGQTPEESFERAKRMAEQGAELIKAKNGG